MQAGNNFVIANVVPICGPLVRDAERGGPGPMEAGALTHEAAAVQPDTRARFADLVQPHLDALYGYCLRLSKRAADADDLLQETLLHGLRARVGLRDASRVRPWLF